MKVGIFLTLKDKNIDNLLLLQPKRKKDAVNGKLSSVHPIYEPRLDPISLMPKIEKHHYTALSLFSGCGGLDLGFDYAGFKHIGSYEILDAGSNTIKRNRPNWVIKSGEEGNVKNINWSETIKQDIDVLHGGPPCQPFSNAGRQKGSIDGRDLFPEFVRAVNEINPCIFVIENVGAITNRKFKQYFKEILFNPLASSYAITTINLNACDYGVPQRRNRVFIIGMQKRYLKNNLIIPKPTHSCEHLINSYNKEQTNDLFETYNQSKLRCMGVREALGLPNVGLIY